MSIRTRLQAILVATPNLFTGSAHMGLVALAALIALIPKVGHEISKVLIRIGDQYTKDSEERETTQRDRLLELENMDMKAAKKAAEVAAQAAQLIKEQAKSLSEKRAAENKVQADIEVLEVEEQCRNQVTDVDKVQRVERALRGKELKINEHKITHRTAMFSRLKEHLDTMTNLSKALKDASNQAKDSAQSNKGATEVSYKSILGLNKAMGEVIHANSKLYKALADYDYTVAEGDMDAEKERAISSALLESMQAEKKIETVIATNDILHKSELKTDFMADVADKNQELDDRLHHYSKRTLDKLAYLIHSEMETAQVEIANLTNPADNKEICQDRLQKLSTMLDQVNKISLEKTNEDPLTARLA